MMVFSSYLKNNVFFFLQRMSGSRNAGGCSSLLSKMNIGREASSDYDLDEPDGSTEEVDAPTNN
jgi:hypothetical protein